MAGLPAAFTFTAARELGLSEWALYRLRDDGLITPLGRGLYQRADLDGADPDLLAIATRAPRATLCLRTAMARHGLIDDIPAAIDVALPRGSRAPVLQAPVSWHHFDVATFDLGREDLAVGPGCTIGVYSAERCIADAFRLVGHEGPELGNEALRRWLRRRGSSPAALLELAAQLPRTEASLRRSLQILL
ncbi:type IV toxin-antitoxin system AbiEi family antitoxin domain-containing protein [Blastococcus sp. SYSU DS1024]